MSEQDRQQRTEAPTPRKIQKSKEEGKTGFSSELVGSMILAAGIFYFWIAGRWFFTIVCDAIRRRSTDFQDAIMDPTWIATHIRQDIISIGGVCLGFLIPVFLVAFVGGVLQTQFNFSIKPLNIKLEKLNPIKGFRNIFSLAGAFKGALSLTKTALIVVTVLLVTRAKFDEIQISTAYSFQAFMELMALTAIYSSLGIVATMLLVGIADLAFQKWKHYQDIRMTKQEIRDEHRETEGDPLMRARVKRLQSEIGRHRMMQSVAESSVVITNPTHFAVAIRYDQNKDVAPVLLAKGADHLAKQIIAKAKEAGVPVVERKAVARFVYFNVKLGSQIPFEIYQVIAEILNYVRRVRSLV